MQNCHPEGNFQGLDQTRGQGEEIGEKIFFEYSQEMVTKVLRYLRIFHKILKRNDFLRRKLWKIKGIGHPLLNTHN